MHAVQVSRTTIAAEGLGHPEGLVLLPDGRLAFVEGYASRVMLFEDGQLVPSVEVDGMPTALAVSAGRKLLALRATGKTRSWTAPRPAVPAILEIDLDRNTFEVVETKASAMPLRHPHGLGFGPDGALYFTDCEFAPDRPDIRAWICRFGPTGAEVIFELENTYPTGIAFDAAGRLTWAELSTKRIVRSDPPYSKWEIVAQLQQDAAPDGFAYATDGRLLVSTLFSGGIDTVSPSQPTELPVRLKWADDVVATDCMFDEQVLWVTDARGFRDPSNPSGRLWRLETNVVGARLLPPWPSTNV